MNTVLLVDDEEHIRRDLRKRLENKQYLVHTAASPENARKIVLSEELDYAIIDLTLDFTYEFGGTQLVSFVSRIQPRVRTIVLSAYAFEDVKGQLQRQLDGEPGSEQVLAEIESNYVSKGVDKNYITAILDKLEALVHHEEKKRCFVIMPFSATNSCREDEWTEIFENVIKPAVEHSGHNYECERSQALVGNIIEDILDQLNRADLVIADLSDRNPNVYYELGVRHALRDSTILIAQSLDDIPFDLRPYATQTYDWKTTRGRDAFKKRIKEIVNVIEDSPDKALSPVRKYLNL